MGASSIRLVEVGRDGERLHFEERARIPNHPATETDDGTQRLVWEYPRIFSALSAALGEAGHSGTRYASIGADSWGVDYVLLDRDGRRIGPPISYRDARTDGMIERYVRDGIPADRLFAQTGIPALGFNTLYQLYAETLRDPESLRQTAQLLFTADYAHYWLSGIAGSERSLASTSQMLSLDGRWNADILHTLALPAEALARPVAAGTELGPLSGERAQETGLSLTVIAPATHDTQSAILAIPAEGDDWAYLSSGTWSILGVESPVPFAGPQDFAAGLGNEAGFGGTFTAQWTVTGLWLAQEVQRLLGPGTDPGALAMAAEEVAPFRTLIDPSHPRFHAPADMIAEIRAAAREAGEPVPETPAELTRCIYDSLALFYRLKLAELSALTGRTLSRLHVVGGGSRARLLNHICACVTGLPLFAGPAEATALGNGLAQMIALGEIADVRAARALVRDSFPPLRFDPAPLPGLDAAIARFARLHIQTLES